MVNFNSTIFRTITDEVTGANKSIGLFGKSFTELKGILSSVKTNGLFKTSIVSQTDLNCITKYNNSIKDGATHQYAMEQATVGASSATAQMIKNANGNTIALNQMTLGAKAATVTMKALNVALNVGVMLLASWALPKLFDFFDSLITTSKEITESANNAKEAIASINSELDNLKDTTNEIKTRYAELAQGVNQLSGKNLTLSTDDYEEFLDLSNQLAELFPTLVKGYDENGNAILDLSGNVNTIVLSLNDLIKAEKELANQQILEEMPDVYKGFSQNVKDLNTSLTENRDILKSLENINFDNIIPNEYYGNNGYQLKFNVDPEAKDDVMSALYEALRSQGFKFDEDFSDLSDSFDSVDLWISDKLYDAISNNPEIHEAFSGFFNNYVSDIRQSIYDAENDLKTEYSSFNNTLINNVLANDYDYASLSNNMQFAIQQIIGNTNWAEAEKSFEESGWDGAQAYVRGIINEITNASTEVKSAILELYNNPDLTFQEKNNYLDTIINYYKSQDLEVPISFTFQKNELTDLSRRVEKSMRIMSDDRGGINRETWTELENFMQDFSEEDYQTWLEVTSGINNAEEAMQAYINATKDATSETKKLSYIDIISSVQGLSEGLDQLDKIYSDVLDGKNFDYSSILNNEDFADTFSKYTDEYNEFIQAIANSPSDIQACQSAFNNLATAYINASGAIDNVTEETKDATIAMLEQMGVTNSSEVITRQLAVQKEVLCYETGDLKDATYDEIYALYEEADAGSIAQQALAQYAFQKSVTEGIDLNESDNIEQLYNLAQAAGASAQTLSDLAEVMWLVSEAQARGGRFNYQTGKFESGFDSSWWSSEQQKLVDSFKDGTYETSFTLSATDFKFDYSGGDKSNSVKEGASNTADAWKEAFEKELAELQHNHEMGYITDFNYYTSLDALNEKYFAGKEEYLDEYRQYEEEVYKGLKSYYEDYVSSNIDLLEKQLDANIITYKEYTSTVSNLLNDMYKNGKISAEKYFESIKQYLEKQKSSMDGVISAVVNKLDKRIDELNDQIDAVEDIYQKQIDAIDDQIKALEEKKNLLQDESDELDKQLALEQSLYELDRANNQRTQGLYVEGRGKIYTNDQDAIRDAEDNVRKAKLDIQISEIDNAISRLEKQQETLQDAMDSEKEALQEIIDRLESYKDQWNSVANEYEETQNELLAEQILGADWESQILDGRIDVLNAFKDDYISIQQAIADAAWAATNEQIEAAKEASKGASGSLGSASSIANNVSNVSKSTSSGSKGSSGTGNSSSSSTFSTTPENYKNGSTSVSTLATVIHADTNRTYFSGTVAEAKNYIATHNMTIISQSKSGNTTIYKVRYKNVSSDLGIRHSGLDTGYVGSNTSKKESLEILKKAAKDGLKNDEELNILKHGELVLTNEQSSNIVEKIKGFEGIKYKLISENFKPNISIPNYSYLANGLSSIRPIEQHNQFNVSLPNINDSSSATKLMQELQRLPLDALQYSSKINI